MSSSIYVYMYVYNYTHVFIYVYILYLTVCRRGFAFGLGVLPRLILEGRLDQVLDGLLAAASIDKDIPAVYTEARRDAIRSISKYVIIFISTDKLQIKSSSSSSSQYQLYHDLVS